MTENGFDLEPSEHEDVRAHEIKGLDTIMGFADDVVTYLNNYDEFEERGVKFPYEGAAFVGERGTGKTTVAKYIATESEALFVNLANEDIRSGSEISIPNIYDSARNYVYQEGEPVILFQDEMDKTFGINSGYGGPEDDDNYNDLIQELSGIKGSYKNPGIFFLGTANEMQDGLALLRDGRLNDIHFYAPGREVRREIMDHYLGEKEGEFNVDTEMLSHMIKDGTTPAEIENLIESSFFHAVKDSLGEDVEVHLTTEDVYEELAARTITGKTDDDRTDKEREDTAHHEIGHYAVARELGLDVPFVTVEPSIQAMGQTHLIDPGNVVDMERAIDYAAVNIAGYVAERKRGNKPMGGVKEDFNNIDRLASRAAEVMEMDELYEEVVGQEGDDTRVSIDWDQTAEAIEALQKLETSMGGDALSLWGEIEVLEKLDRNKLKERMFKAEAVRRAEEVIENYEQQDLMTPLADKLLEEETVFGRDLDEIVGQSMS